MKIPRIEYEVFYHLSDNKLQKLKLSLCSDSKIKISIPLEINEKEIDKYNLSSNYYKDICYKSSSENGIDLIISDRKEEFIKNNMNICEENCEFQYYSKEEKKDICSCNVKLQLKIFQK